MVIITIVGTCNKYNKFTLKKVFFSVMIHFISNDMGIGFKTSENLGFILI